MRGIDLINNNLNAALENLVCAAEIVRWGRAELILLAMVRNWAYVEQRQTLSLQEIS
jgi:hypothetical protein